MSETTNRLANETSPYLRQHAHNPVDWHPWGDEALERARAERKPILLSIGYSACHWCHVMAHESFEDAETAALMNARFVNIKVDREERPDLDRIYQTAHQVIAQRAGGWPLTMFLTSDGQLPFYGGTYFPKTARYGMPAFRDVLRHVADYYVEHPLEAAKFGAQLGDVLKRLDPDAGGGATLDASLLDAAVRAMTGELDVRHGGFGHAPKFPHATSLELLLRRARASERTGTSDAASRHAAIFTLARMAAGGIYDQIGGGFSRYSVDDRWMIPHFEKMLYDNGPLLALYAEAHAYTSLPEFARIARETAAWTLREMRAPEGGFWSALDADSEGEEGKYYVWKPDDVRTLVTADEYAVLARRFGFDRTPNFEGHWHLYVCEEIAAVAAALGIEESRARELLDSGRTKLLAAREGRIRPGLDDKVLASWNGLMIRGLAIAARHLDAPELADAATAALDFIRTTMWRDGRLLAAYKDGRARFPAYLDDHAFLIDAALELLQLRWRAEDLAFADDLARSLIERFEDRERGGFWFTAHDHEALIHRSRTFSDDSMASGNGVAAKALARLGHLLGHVEYLEAAERTLRAAAGAIERYPQAHASLLIALEEWLEPPDLVILRGNAGSLERWRNALRGYAPRRLVFAIPANAAALPEALAARAPRGAAVAYVCRGATCSPPILYPDELSAALEAPDVPA
jgi:uncharacterized protein YyaL (SSP411 family)